MKIYFVRHGHPDYKHDCLTEIGHKQAEAAAERLKNSKIQEIYASTKGRAMQTAEYTAKQLGLEIVPCDFMRDWMEVHKRRADFGGWSPLACCHSTCGVGNQPV